MDDHKKDRHTSPEGKISKQKNSPGRKQVDRRNWKLIADPALGKGQEKIYRFDGILSGNPVPIPTRDPRFRLNRLKLKDEPLDLPVPVLKLDEHFVGKLPPKDVTFTGLNDNINENFLAGMCRPFGEVEAVEIFTHPRTGKHLGIARVLYCSVKSARLCIERLHNTLKMGKVIQAFLDVGGKQRAKLISDLTNETRYQNSVANHADSVDVDSTKELNSAETKAEDRTVKKPGGDAEVPKGQNSIQSQHQSISSHGSAKIHSVANTSHRLSTAAQQLPSMHSETVAPFAAAIQPVNTYPLPPPGPLSTRQADRQSTLSHTEAEVSMHSEPEIMNSIELTLLLDKEEGEIGSDDTASASDCTEGEVEEEGGESLEQRIAALLTGKDNKSKEAQVSNAQHVPPNRVGVSRPIADSKASTARYPVVSEESNTVLPVDTVMPFPCPVMPLPPPPPFALPHGMRPPASAIFVTKDQHGTLFNATFESLLAELRRTLYRDLCRRLLEQCAFRHLDSWWVKNEIRNRTKKPVLSVEESSSQPLPQVVSEKQQGTYEGSANSATEVNSWEKMFRQGGVFGLRDTLPKLPSFRRKDSQPQPVPRNQSSASNNSHPVSSDAKSRSRKISLSSNNSAQNSDSTVTDDEVDNRSSNNREKSPKRNKVLLTDSDDQSESSALSTSSDESEDFLSSSDEGVSESKNSSDISSSDQKSRTSEKLAKKTDLNLNSQSSNNDDAHVIDTAGNSSPTAKSVTSPVTSPQKPKARWASLLQEQESQKPNISSVADASIDTAIGDVKQSHPSAVPRLQSEKQLDKSKPKSSKPMRPTKALPKRTKKSEPAEDELESDSSTESDNDQIETSESEEADSEEEVNFKSKGKKKTPVAVQKTPPVKRPAVKSRQSSAKVKEPLQQQQQPAAKTAPISPQVNRKPIVKRVNTVTVKEESQDSDLNKIDNELDDSSKSFPDPRLPDFLIDHCYVPVSHLQQLPVVPEKPLSSKSTDKPTVNFKPRDRDAEEAIATSFVRLGIDSEDLQYLERSYEELLQNYSQSYYWLNETHWVKHPATALAEPLLETEVSPRKKRRVVATSGAGCARCDLEWRGGKVARPHGPAGTETVEFCESSVVPGGIELSRAMAFGAGTATANTTTGGCAAAVTATAIERLGADIGKTTKAAKAELREARSHQRRLLACFSSGGTEEKRDILGFNLLKYRKKRVRFARSGIHGWGLYALEPIAAEEMVVEYAGELVRKTVGDLREKKYARLGVDGSYMFRVDDDLIVDATMAGNYGRFINHSCAPNCYAKVITVEGQKKIVIYSKREIAVSEEITYDYKFPLEPAANKIICHCAASTCRNTLN